MPTDAELAERLPELLAAETTDRLIGRIIAIAAGFEIKEVPSGDLFDQKMCGMILREVVARLRSLARPYEGAEAEAREIAVEYATGHPLEGLAAGQLAEDIIAALHRAAAAERERWAKWLETKASVHRHGEYAALAISYAAAIRRGAS